MSHLKDSQNQDQSTAENGAEPRLSHWSEWMRAVAMTALKYGQSQLSQTPTRMRNKFSSVRQAIEKIDSEVKLHHYNIRNFTPHISFRFERGHYLVKTVETGAELEECLRLRFEVFHKEYMNKTRTYGIDVDKLDYTCDHLMIYDSRSEKTVGTYRLNSSLYTSTFYSAGEFDLGTLPDLEGNKLELGRACINRDDRTGVVIALLWRGIAEYIRRTQTKVLLGCGSIKTMDPLEIGRLTKHFRDSGVITDQYGVTPTKKYKVKQLPTMLDYLDKNPTDYSPETIRKMIPALFNSYLKMGAKLGGEPAIDREFHCIDFLTIVKMDELPDAIREKFQV